MLDVAPGPFFFQLHHYTFLKSIKRILYAASELQLAHDEGLEGFVLISY